MPVQQAPAHRHLKWAEGTAENTSGKDRETINQHPYILVEWHGLFLLSNQVKEGMCLGWGKKEVTGCQELCRTLAWQTATWSQQWQSPNPGKSLLPLLKILMRIWSARQGGDPGAADTPCHCLLSPAIVSLSPYWPSRGGDERDTTAQRGLPTQAPAPAWLRGTPDSTDREQTCGMTSRRRQKRRTNRSCLQKTQETKQQLNRLHLTGFLETPT